MLIAAFARRVATTQTKARSPFRGAFLILAFVFSIGSAERVGAAGMTHRGSTSAIAQHLVDKAATTTTVTSLHNPSTYTAGVLITVTVAPAAPAGDAQPTGSIKLFIDGIPYFSGIPLGNSNAVNIWIHLTGGLHSVSAQYLGDENFEASDGALAGGQTVDRSTLAFPIKSAAPNPTQVGQEYTVEWEKYAFAAVLQPPTGVVTVTDGTDTCTALVSTGSCVLKSTTPGHKTLITSYHGDNNWNPAVSSGVPHTVLTSIDGRVLSPDGVGIRNASVVLTDAQGVSRMVPSNSLGYFSFDKIALGQTYTITVRTRRYRFESRTLSVNGPVQNVMLVGLE